MLPVLWDLIGSYATLAEQPIWALATKDFDRAYQFNQKWLEFLPRLMGLAAAEGSIAYLEEAQRLFGTPTYDAAHRARLAAAASGHVNALEWLEERQPTRYIYSAEYGDYIEGKGIDSTTDPTDAVRVWVAGAAHAEVRTWARNIADKHYNLIPLGKDVRRFTFSSAASCVAAQQGNLNALEILFNDREYFSLTRVQHHAIVKGHISVVEWYDTKMRGSVLSIEDTPGHSIITAVKHDQLGMMKVLVGKKYTVPKDEICAFARSVEMLKYLVSIGCTLNKDTYSSAAEDGSIAILEWLHEQKCPCNLYQALYSAVSASNYPVIQYLLSTWNPANDELSGPAYMILDTAVGKGDFRSIHLCLAGGIKLHSTAMTKAATNNRISTMELLKSLGAPMHADACNAALEHRNYEAYQWLRRTGCPQNAETARLLWLASDFVKNGSS